MVANFAINYHRVNHFPPPQGGFLHLPLLSGFLFSECMMQTTDAVVEAAQVAPAASIAVMSFWDYGVSDWAYLVFLIYTIVLIIHFVWVKLVRPWKRLRRMRRARGASDVF